MKYLWRFPRDLSVKGQLKISILSMPAIAMQYIDAKALLTKNNSYRASLDRAFGATRCSYIRRQYLKQIYPSR